MVSRFREGVIVLALAAAGLAAAAVQDPDPGDQLARVRVIVSTRAANAAVTVRGATIASYISVAHAEPNRTHAAAVAQHRRPAGGGALRHHPCRRGVGERADVERHQRLECGDLD
jgi:hypothetical protein